MLRSERARCYVAARGGTCLFHESTWQNYQPSGQMDAMIRSPSASATRNCGSGSLYKASAACLPYILSSRCICPLADHFAPHMFLMCGRAAPRFQMSPEGCADALTNCASSNKSTLHPQSRTMRLPSRGCNSQKTGIVRR